MKVAIVVGHEESKQGAVNKSSGMTEFQFNQDLACRIHQILYSVKGIKSFVVFRDNGYEQLPYDVNRTGCDIAIELHCNAFNEKAKGCETLYWGNSKKGKLLASSIQDAIITGYKPLADRGLKPKSNGDRGAYFLQKTAMPSVILEPFFIDNDLELNHANANFDKLAESIAYGIEAYKESL